MDPYYEQRLRDEVRYLHSLWHQGPPNRRTPNPQTRPALIPRPPYPIAASAKRKSRPEIDHTHTPNKKPPPPQPDPRWETPLPDDSAPSSTWPSSSPKLIPASEEQKLRHRAVRLHARALDFCGGSGSGSDSGSDEEEDENEDDGDGESEEYKLFMKLFVEDKELRSFYEGNWDGGEFYCLVCGGLGKTKKIKGCAGLVQHAVMISKTKKKRAHRAFGEVVCRVLGWDFKRMPFVVLKGETLGFYLANPGNEQAVLEGNAADNEDVAGGFEDNVGGKEATDDDLMICQNSLKDDCANQEKETIDTGILETKEEKEEAASTRSDAEVNADRLDNVLKDNVGAENDVTAEYSEKEAITDHQCKELMKSSLKPPMRPTSEWPVSLSKLNLAPASEEELLRHYAIRLHTRALEVCGRFLAGSGSGSESEEEEDDDDCTDGENEEYTLLLKLFVEDSELRSYYEGNWDGGEFYCLVCGGLGKTKRTKGCAALVQHASSINKTKKKRAHRAFGQVVCRVLGWDFRRMPSVVLKGERLSFYLANPGNELEEAKVKAGVRNNVVEGRDADAVSAEKEALDEDNYPGDDGSNRCNEFLDKGISENKEDTEKAVNTWSEPEVHAEQFDNVLKDNVLAVNDVTAESSEKEAITDQQCNDKELIIYESSLTNDGTEKSIGSLDDGKIESIKEAIQEEAKDALVEVAENADDDKHDLVGFKEKLDNISGYTGEIPSKEEPEVSLVDGTPMACELQAEPEKNVDGPNDDLNIFLENLEPL